MAFKRMITKLALAFAAKKGMDAFNAMGGMSGLASRLDDSRAGSISQANAHLRTDGTSSPSPADGLGNILRSIAGNSSLASGGNVGSAQSNPLGASLGTLFGTLANAMNNADPSAQSNDDLERQFEMQDVTEDREARPMVRAMVHMARADGTIDPDEQTVLMSMMQDASAEEQAGVPPSSVPV